MGNYSQPFPTAIDAIIRALETAMPERVTGGHYGTFSGFRFMGKTATGATFDCHVCGYGGWGASQGRDGTGPFRTMAHGDTRLIPMELQEAIYPLRIEALSLRPDSGGPGAYRGGLGTRNTYRMLVPCKLIVKFDRIDCPPWGVAGGKPGLPGFVTVEKANGQRKVLRKTKGYALEAGDMVYVEAGGGGGWGDPAKRALNQVQRDVAQGYVTPAAALRDYGITISADGRTSY